MRCPKISIIVPVYNVEKYLRRCVDSILAQDFADFELLLIDDGSTDESGVICDEYALVDNRVRVFHKDNGGVSSARNLGLDNVRGEWVTYIDSDDYVDSRYCYELLKGSEDFDVVTCDIIIVEDNNKCTQVECYGWKDTSPKSVGEFIINPFTCVWGTLQRRQLYDEHNLRFPIGIKYCEDFHLLFKLYTCAKKARRLDKALYYYYQHSNSIVHNKNEDTERGERWVCLDLIEFSTEQGSIEVSEQYLSWRLLYASISMLRTPKRFREFAELYKNKRMYIWTCPFLSKRQKMIAWFICYHMVIVATLIFFILKKIGKNI